MDKKVKIIVERTYTGEKPMETVFKEICAENMREVIKDTLLHKKEESQQDLLEKME